MTTTSTSGAVMAIKGFVGLQVHEKGSGSLRGRVAYNRAPLDIEFVNDWKLIRKVTRGLRHVR